MFKSKKSGSQCPLYGNQARSTEEFYSNLTRILIMRFMERLKSNNGDSYSDGILDCIHDALGRENLNIGWELGGIACLEKFEQRHSVQGE